MQVRMISLILEKKSLSRYIYFFSLTIEYENNQ